MEGKQTMTIGPDGVSVTFGNEDMNEMLDVIQELAEDAMGMLSDLDDFFTPSLDIPGGL
jgi:hypothetical protein